MKQELFETLKKNSADLVARLTIDIGNVEVLDDLSSVEHKILNILAGHLGNDQRDCDLFLTDYYHVLGMGPLDAIQSSKLTKYLKIVIQLRAKTKCVQAHIGTELSRREKLTNITGDYTCHTIAPNLKLKDKLF